MLFLHIFVSLDGYIEDESGGIEWFRESDDFDKYIVTLLGSIEGMVFRPGRCSPVRARLRA